jgi:hypothetical protein
MAAIIANIEMFTRRLPCPFSSLSPELFMFPVDQPDDVTDQGVDDSAEYSVVSV